MEASLKVWSPGRLAFFNHVARIVFFARIGPADKGIAQIFYDMAWIERWGSGVQKIRTACAERAGATVLITTDGSLV
jgi:predicted HTH transcriptional regulator